MLNKNCEKTMVTIFDYLIFFTKKKKTYASLLSYVSWKHCCKYISVMSPVANNVQVLILETKIRA